MSGMSRVVGLLVGVTLITSATGAWADSGGKPKTPAVTRPDAPMSTARGVVKSVSGTRLAVETGQPGAGAEILLVLDERTVLTKRGKTITVRDLRAGDPVTVSYTKRDGRVVAKRVWVRSTGEAAGALTGSAGAVKGR